MNGEVGWSSLEIRFKNTKNPICIYLLWRSNDFNAMFVTVEDMETGHTKKYKYIGVSSPMIFFCTSGLNGLTV